MASAAGVLASSLSSEPESDPDDESALAAFFGAGLSESEESESEEDSTLDFFFGTTAFSAVF